MATLVQQLWRVTVFLCLWTSALAAQSLVPSTGISTTEAAPDLSEPLTETEAQALISRLSDSEVREILLEQLGTKSAEAAAAEQVTFSEFTDTAIFGVGRSLADAVNKLPLAGETFGRAWGVFVERMGPGGFAFAFLVLAIAVGAALAVELVFRRLIRNWVESREVSDEPGLRDTLMFLIKRLTGDVVAVFIFFVAANLIAILAAMLIGPIFLQSREQGMIVTEYMGPIWVNLIVLPRLAGAIGRFLLAPQRPEFRIVFTDDATAIRLFWHQIGLVFLLGLTFWVPRFLEMNGEQFGSSRIGFWLNLSLHIYFIWIAWRFRKGLELMMRGPDPDVTPGEAWASRAYPIMLVVMGLLTLWIVEILAGLGLFDILRGMPHIQMLSLLAFAPAMDTVVRSLVRHLMPPMQGEGPVAERAHESSQRSYIRIGRVIVFATAILLIAQIWHIDLTNLAAAGIGAQLAGRMIEFLIILSIGYLIFELVSLYINRKLADEMTAAGYDPNNEDFGGDGGGAGGSRLSTVLPLILAVAQVTIVVVFVLLGLSNLGVDTTPLLAGAGIIGLAVGFGAQKLVTDVVSGIFFLVDDAFRTGEYVEVEGTVGTVEKISIRSMQLRHHKGPVHTIPYGEIPKITNYSRDWVIMKLRFTVPFDTDPNKVKKIFKKIGAEMLDHEVLGQDFLQPFKSQGVLEIDDVGMVIRGKFMAKPGKQFMIRKEIFNRVSAEFGEAGIDFARREVRVAIPGMENKEELTEEDKAAIAAAASQAAETAQADQAQSQDDR